MSIIGNNRNIVILNSLSEEQARYRILECKTIGKSGKSKIKTKEIPEEYRNLFLEVDKDIDIQSVILSEKNVYKINTFINEFEYRDRLKYVGLSAMNKLLFYGDSGCGKTFLGKALNNRLGYTMLYVNISQALVGESVPETLNRIFTLSRDGGYVIFLDECDNIAWTREDSKGDTYILKVVESLFQMIDSMNQDNVLICATNLKHKLDEAFERRFQSKLKFEKPKESIRELAQRFLYNGFTIVNDVGGENMIHTNSIETLQKLSYAEIKDIMEMAMKRAIMNSTYRISLLDIYKDVSNTITTKIELR